MFLHLNAGRWVLGGLSAGRRRKTQNSYMIYRLNSIHSDSENNNTLEIGPNPIKPPKIWEFENSQPRSNMSIENESQ
jgi:hypothetical protein